MIQEKESKLFPRRVARLSFLCRYLLWVVAAAIFCAMLQVCLVLASQPGPKNIAALLVAELCLLAVVVYLLYYGVRYVNLPRIRDAGMHGAFALLIFVPLINILFLLFLLFAPTGTAGKKENQTANQASDATSEPAPGADSSSHQG